MASGQVSIRSGAKLNVMSGGFRCDGGCWPDSGHRMPHWTPRGVQRRPGYPAQGPAFIDVCVRSDGSGFRVASQKSGPVAGDVPRFARQHTNIARKEPETPSGWTLARLQKPARVSTADQPRFARAHDPEHIAMDSFRKAIRLAVWCLSGNCLTRLPSLDTLTESRGPPRTPSTSSRVLASRSSARR